MGETKELGPLEVRVLGLLDAKQPVGVAEVRARLEREGNELAYTTVMTVLTRLHQKGVVKRTREGNRFLYAPAAATPRVLQGMLSRVQKALSASTRAEPFLALLEDEALSHDELRALRRAIDKKLAEKKK